MSDSFFASGDDGTTNVTDAIVLVNSLYGSGEQPKEPFPEPGHDPTGDGLACPRPAEE